LQVLHASAVVLCVALNFTSKQVPGHDSSCSETPWSLLKISSFILDSQQLDGELHLLSMNTTCCCKRCVPLLS
jgi:hypothetical protein